MCTYLHVAADCTLTYDYYEYNQDYDYEDNPQLHILPP